jgi:flavin-dependent thymidylate synthase
MGLVAAVNVELIGTYGGDVTHAMSAWTSTYRDLDPERRLRIPNLLYMLANPPEGEEVHGTPFEKSDIHFLVRCEQASHIHLLKHRIGVSINGESARYKELKEPTCHAPEDWPSAWKMTMDSHFRNSVELYRECLAELEPVLGRKRAKESARFFLPMASELTLDVSFNWRSFTHFLKLRRHHTAQREINAIADEMLRLVQGTGDFKYSLQAFHLPAE